jgi:hypothetical protein
MAAGRAPVNSLWFWGGGMLPDRVSTAAARVLGGDALLQALALQAAVLRLERGDRFAPADADALVDLRDARDAGALFERWLLPAVEAMRAGALRELRLDFLDGAGCVLLPGQRWRIWRSEAAGFSRLPPHPPGRDGS